MEEIEKYTLVDKKGNFVTRAIFPHLKWDGAPFFSKTKFKAFDSHWEATEELSQFLPAHRENIEVHHIVFAVSDGVTTIIRHHL